MSRINIDEAGIPMDFSADRIMRKISEDCREDFNERFFERSDDENILELKKIILSCQREEGFLLKVINFTTVTNQEEIDEILWKHDMERPVNSRSKIKHECINLKDSSCNLLIVNWYMEVYGTEGENRDKPKKGTMEVLILVPRVINRIFYRISGNEYAATYQIADGSVYNNSTKKNAKSYMLSFKSLRPVRIYRYIDAVTTVDGIKLNSVLYTSNIQNKLAYAMKYILAKFGLHDAMAFMNIKYVDILPPNSAVQVDDDNYLFQCKNSALVRVPKIIYDNEVMVQSFVSTLIKSIVNGTSYGDMFTPDYWVAALAENKGKINYDKGLNILADLEFIYDIRTREDLRLPDGDKSTIYHVIYWMMKEFPILRARSNTDIYYKKLQSSYYLACLYSSKLSKAVLKLSNMRRNDITIDSVKSRIYTKPDILLYNMTSDPLINYNNRVNDNYAFTALKWSFKGTGGIAENSNNSIQDIYKNVDVSHAGVLDMTASSATDPGVAGLICPMTPLTDNMFFYDYEEPNNWEASFDELIRSYEELKGIRQAIEMIPGNVITKDDIANHHMVVESIESLKRLAAPFVKLELECPIVMIDQPEEISIKGNDMILGEEYINMEEY